MKKRDIILDFTSLLDVIMILLFIVMSNTALASAKVSEEVEQQKEDLAAAEKRIQDLEDDLQMHTASEESYAVYTSEAVIITMYNSIRDDDHILTIFRGEYEADPLQIVMGENSTVNTRSRINSYISDILQTAEGHPVYIVFQYDKYTIYRTEFEAVTDELRQLSRRYKEVFFKETERTEN